MHEPIIRLCAVTRHPPTAAHPIVQQLDLALYPNEILVLLGPSGSGKTTTLRLIAGLEIPDSGDIIIRGVCVTNRSRPLAPEARRVGMVFQDYALFPHMTVGENIRFALHNYPKQTQMARVNNVLARVGLTGLAERYPHQLSGGQQQRVAIARALAPEPPVVLLDEPFSNLDTTIREHVRGELRAILRDAQTAAIIVTHDQSEALAIADRIALLHEGVLHQTGSPEELFTSPRTRFAASFMGHANFVHVERHGTHLHSALGQLAITQAPACDDTAVPAVLARYDDIGFAEDSVHANAWIRERHYEGTVYHYLLELSSGQHIHCKRSHEHRHEVGSRVRAYYTATHPLVYFCGDQACGHAVALQTH